MIDFIEPGLRSYDVPDDYADAFLSLDAADWSRVRHELQRTCGLLPRPGT